MTPGNLEDDLERLAEADWIVEAVVEKLDGQAGALRADREGAQSRRGGLVQHLDPAARQADRGPAQELPARLPDHPLLQPAPLHAPARGGRRAGYEARGARADRGLRRPPARQERGPLQGHAGLHRQPDRLVLAAGGVLRGVRDGPAGRGGGSGAGPPARHPQDRGLRPRRSGRHRPSAPRRGEPARSAARGRRLPRGRSRVAAGHEADRDRLHRAQGQGRLLSPRQGRRPARQGGDRPCDRRLSRRGQAPARCGRCGQGRRPARAARGRRAGRALRLAGDEPDARLRLLAGAGDRRRHHRGRSGDAARLQLEMGPVRAARPDRPGLVRRAARGARASPVPPLLRAGRATAASTGSRAAACSI